jgi:undecaprenyl pyrophosphate synthase
MEGVVNKVNVRDIDDEHVLRILRDYSKREWTRTDGILLYMR